MAGKPGSVSLFCNSFLLGVILPPWLLRFFIQEKNTREGENWDREGLYYMGYNLKTNYCDFAELEKGGIATIPAIFGLSNSLEEAQQNNKGESIVDLKLGTFGDFGNSFLKDHRASLMEPFSSSNNNNNDNAGGSSKRARTPSGGTQVVSCLVDGCKSDLSKCRDYHRRHKVCEMHSKTPRVTIGGHEQRFCQQCSRFHSLGEFDEGKRSCRKRLEGHNRRRRKPQPEPLPMNPGNFLSAGQGSRFLPFSNQPIIPANSVVSSTWSGGAIKAETNPTLYTTSSLSASSYSHHAYKGGSSSSNNSRQFPFLQGGGPDPQLTGASSSPSSSSLAGQSLHHHHHHHHNNNNNPSCDSGNNSGNNSTNQQQQKMFCCNNNNNNNGLNQMMDSDRALSLLSSSSSSPTETHHHTPEMGLGRIMSPMGPARPVISGLHYGPIGPFSGPQAQGLGGGGGSGLMSNMRSNNHQLCQDVFQSGTDESSHNGGGHHQTLSFSWE